MNPPIDSPAPRSAIAACTPTTAPKLFEAVHHRFVERCRRMLELAFIEAEDALQEASIGARNDSAREAIEQLRAHRNAVLSNYARALGARFNALLQVPEDRRAVADLAAKMHLDLLESKGFGAISQVRALATRLGQQHRSALDLACKRLHQLAPQAMVNPANSPLEPTCIVDTFIRVAHTKSLSQTAKKALFEEFERQLERKSGTCFAEVNKVLGGVRIAEGKPVNPLGKRPQSHRETTAVHAKQLPAAALSMAARSKPRACTNNVASLASIEPSLSEQNSAIPLLKDKVEEPPALAARIQGAAEARVATQARAPAGKPAPAPAKSLNSATGQQLQPKQAPAGPQPAHLVKPRQLSAPPNVSASGKAFAANRMRPGKSVRGNKWKWLTKSNALQREILQFYRQRPVMSAQDNALDDPRARAAAAYLGDKAEHEQVIALCTELFDEIQNDDNLPTLVRQKLICLQAVYTAYAVNRNPNFLIQPASPARCLLELLWDLGRALEGTAALGQNIIYIQISETVESMKMPSLAEDRDFLREFRKILATVI